MPELSNSQIERLLHPYKVDANDEICDGIRRYLDLLLKWNQRIALTTITDPEQIVRFHFGESMFACSAVPIRNGRLADVGSGPGFPSIPIGMVKSSLDVISIESNLKKSTFQSEVVRSLSLRNISLYRGRMEDYDGSAREINFVTARALGMFEELLHWSRVSLAEHGKIILWLGESDIDRLGRIKTWSWLDPIKIPQSDRRFLLVGSPRR
jgi:16S rRNA (guanine527-N7)-methyltransferase